jgi:hypothetical protein
MVNVEGGGRSPRMMIRPYAARPCLSSATNKHALHRQPSHRQRSVHPHQSPHAVARRVAIDHASSQFSSTITAPKYTGASITRADVRTSAGHLGGAGPALPLHAENCVEALAVPLVETGQGRIAMAA